MKNRKVIIALVIILLAAAIGGAAAYYMLAVKSASSDSTVTDTPDAVSLEQGQSIVYAKLTSVIGNNITYSVVEEQAQGGSEAQNTEMAALAQSAVSYVETGETGELQVPVGTDVVTKLGTTTTFVRLSTGNIVAMLMQGDDGVMKIWIVQ